MLIILLKSLAATLLGGVVGIGGVLLLDDPLDPTSLRFWALPAIGMIAALFSLTIHSLSHARSSRQPTPEIINLTDKVLPEEYVDAPSPPVIDPSLPAVPALAQVDPADEFARKDARIASLKKKLHRNSQDLERLKRSYRDLYHNAPVMYFGLDPQGKFVTYNETLLNTLGYLHEELLGKTYAEAIPAQPAAEPDAPPFPKNPGQRQGQKTQWRHKNGSLVDVWIRSTAMVDDDGDFVRWRCSALDLTERNRLADELRTRGDELERMNARLRQINTELEDFTHVVSHDLKEPLRTLQAFSHILAEEYAGQLGPDGFQYINHLVQASSRLGRLVDDLLNLSQAGRITRDSRIFNLNEVVATVRRDLSDLLQRKEAQLVIEGSLPEIEGDPQRITQLVANLVTNGLKYNQTTQPRIVIGQAEHPHAETGQIVCYVRDNGIGIDPKFHQQIFGIFRRLHHQDEYEGTGAGLAICKKIAEAHGGRIWVESQPGQGAAFFFTLPKPVPKSADDESAEEAIDLTPRLPDPNSLARRGFSLRGTRILLVEDMYEIGTLIKKLGQRSGLHFIWFTTAEEAWKYLQTEAPDFILLDKNLPGMDGLELCRRIRLELASKVPIALFSQEQRLEDLKILRKAGANFFISKELLSRPAIWQEKLRELLLKARAKASHTNSIPNNDSPSIPTREEATPA